jgi:hypothetical protein
MELMVPTHVTMSPSNDQSRSAAEHPDDEPPGTGHSILKEATGIRRAFVVHYGWCCHRCLQSFWWRDEDGLVLLVERHLTRCRAERYWGDD